MTDSKKVDEIVQPTKKHRGSTLDSFLEEEGILETTEATAIKRVIAYEFEENHNNHECK